MTAPTDTAGMWVRSERMPDGSYGVAVSVGEDTAFTLAPSLAERYALAVLAAVTTAEHEAAIVATVRAVPGLDDDAAAQIVSDVRDDRRPLDPAGPFQLATNVTRDGRPILAFRAASLPVEDFVIDSCAAAEHANAVLTAMTAADLDATVARVLRTWGIGPEQAAGFVAALARHWPEESPAHTPEETR